MEQRKLTEDEIPTFFEGMGFEADENKPGLYKKEMGNVSVYWDFRNTKKGHFFVPNPDGDGFWSDKDAQQLPEYAEVRKMLGGETKERVKEQKKEPSYPSTPQTGIQEEVKTGNEIALSEYMRGTENKIVRLMDTKLQLDSIIRASEDKTKPGEGLLWHELVFGKKIHKEPSVELVDMITQDMGHITTRIVDFNTNILEDPDTGKKYLTYYCVVEAMDGITGTSGLGSAEQIIDFREITSNGRTFARTNAIRKAERNAKERMIP
ncbi:MAG TPA: hypothetical protein VMY59_01165, partial [Candidatus Thermoplasmatota archaeon]|nr:hypothetical protein [Candidatus Thermoplasmatota archaeon]